MTEARNERLKVLIEAKNEAARVSAPGLAKLESLIKPPNWAGLTIGQVLPAMGLDSQIVQAAIGQALSPLTSQAIEQMRQMASQAFAPITSQAIEQVRAAVRVSAFGVYAELQREYPKPAPSAPLLPWPAERPEPGQVQKVQLTGPELLYQVEQEVRAGRLSKRDLLALFLDISESKPGQQEAPFEIKVRLNEKYESLKRKHGRDFTQEIFVRFHAGEIYQCSVKTFERYRREVKAMQ